MNNKREKMFVKKRKKEHVNTQMLKTSVEMNVEMKLTNIITYLRMETI